MNVKKLFDESILSIMYPEIIKNNVLRECYRQSINDSESREVIKDIIDIKKILLKMTQREMKDFINHNKG